MYSPPVSQTASTFQQIVRRPLSQSQQEVKIITPQLQKNITLRKKLKKKSFSKSKEKKEKNEVELKIFGKLVNVYKKMNDNYHSIEDHLSAIENKLNGATNAVASNTTLGPLYSQANIKLLNQVSSLRGQINELKQHIARKQQSQQRQLTLMKNQSQTQQIAQQAPIIPPLQQAKINIELQQLLTKALQKVKQVKG
jgi:hypothetical protein